jgi:carbon monoxide dehydrogenase subunit G
MSSAEVHRRIKAPIERVWSAATDVPGAATRMSGVDRIELLTDGPFGVGTRWRETRIAPGPPATEELVVTECVPPRRFAVEGSSGGARFRATTTLRAVGADTVVDVAFDAPPPNRAARIVGALLGVLAARTVVVTLNRDLDDLARWCEETVG